MTGSAKIALVTGAGTGVGRAVAIALAKAGYSLVLAGRRREMLDKVSGEINALGAQALAVPTDVSKRESILALFATVKSTFGRLDVLFNNAGTGGANDPADGVTAEGFDAVMHLHVRAALFGMKYAVPLMRAQGGGSIISTASVAGIRTGYGPVLYSIAKAAIVHMTHACAAQLGPENIRVNCICPGLIATNIFAQAFSLPSQLAETRIEAIAEATKGSQPIPRGGRGRDIAEAALYLASDGASFVNGHALVVDGGLTLGATGVAQMAVFAPIVQALGVDPEALAAAIGSRS